MFALVFGLIAAMCDGSSSCKQTIITSAIASGLVLLVGAALVWRFVRINARRRAAGRDPLAWRDIADARLADGDIVAADGSTIDAARELKRQIEWERHVAGMEMATYGRSRTRRFCSKHDRHCREPIDRPHPPGGIDNELAPAEWHPV